jgi:hypothetical protein
MVRSDLVVDVWYVAKMALTNDDDVINSRRIEPISLSA